MTLFSLVPEQAKSCGMDYGELVEAIIADALDHFGTGERAGEAAE
jgi:D-alanine-D-alanine ligase